ncbi:hypothetical protein B0H34DRAFT_793815 [Crassisporium funariophilum]|nr:hypothetical protein B0H34DRAFT_793815 [Crassisporium funariophilum]
MASISDISQVLGDYMLKGWVLTDQSCPTPGCAVPIMRSPKGKTPVITFCAQCNGNPQGTTIHTFKSQSLYRFAAAQPQISAPTSSSNASESSESHIYISRSSTPLTEISEALSSPVFAPLEDTPETTRRREQSDRASSEIGKKLLTGWAMLADECPNEMCYGVPLVRPPRSGGVVDPRKVCVICGNSYSTEVDSVGRELLVPDNALVSSIKAHPPTNSIIKPSQAETSLAHAGTSSLAEQLQERKDPQHHMTQSSDPERLQLISYTADSVLEASSKSLQASLKALSKRLSSLSSQSALDPASIGAAADAISKVTQALANVRQLQRSESQANGLIGL